MSPVRVRTSWSAIRAIPKSVSFARRRALVGLRADDVGRLDVAVDDAARVRVRERGAERRADPQHVAVRQRAVAQQVGERRPLDELGDEVDGVLVAAGLVERDDPGVRQPRGGERLALAAAVGVVADRDPLDGDVALEVLVVGELDDAHPARAEPPAEPVAVEDELARIGGARGLWAWNTGSLFARASPAPCVRRQETGDWRESCRGNPARPARSY